MVAVHDVAETVAMCGIAAILVLFAVLLALFALTVWRNL